jgi:hypothetical protein
MAVSPWNNAHDSGAKRTIGVAMMRAAMNFADFH